LWDVYSAAHKRDDFPIGMLSRGTSQVNWQQVEVAPERIRLYDTGMAITLMALPKGSPPTVPWRRCGDTVLNGPW